MQNTAPEQKRIMRFLPLVFGIVLIRFPAGLFVYWVTSNLISIVQNLLIYRNAPKPGVEEDEPTDADRPEDDGYRAKTGIEAKPPDEPGPNGSGVQQSKPKRKGKARKRR